MQISAAVAELMNAQIGHELGASNQYLQIATFFEARALRKLAELFYKQSEEEREHALKFVRFLTETGAEVRIPAVPAARYEIQSAEQAFQMSVDWEKEVTRQIYTILETAIREKDFASQQFLQWFVEEQVEEISSMENMLLVVQQAGEKNLLMVEAYLSHGA
ncbi:MAG: ferritin [Anaerolineales bacterium]